MQALIFNAMLRECVCVCGRFYSSPDVFTWNKLRKNEKAAA